MTFSCDVYETKYDRPERAVSLLLVSFVKNGFVFVVNERQGYVLRSFTVIT
jgi:hypothetical protein